MGNLSPNNITAYKSGYLVGEQARNLSWTEAARLRGICCWDVYIHSKVTLFGIFFFFFGGGREEDSVQYV